MSNKKCCVPGCINSKGTKEYPLHKFPNPERKVLFNTWVYAIGGDILQLKNEHIFKYRRVCHLHFEEKYLCRNNRLSHIAVPTKNMPADHGDGGAVAGSEGPAGDDSMFDTEVKSEPDAAGGDQNPGFMCNQCHELIVKFRYVCVQCADYDLCDACEAKMEHAHHYMLRVPQGKEQSEVSSVLGSVRLTISSAIAGATPVHAVFSAQSETEKDAEVKEEEPDDDVQEADPLLPIVPSVGDNEQSKMEVWSHKSVYPVIPSSSVAQEVPNLDESALLAQAVASISGTTAEQSPQLQFIVTPCQGGVFQLQTTMKAPEMPVKRKTDTDIYASTSTTATHMAIKRKPVVRQEPILRREPIVRLEPLTETQIKMSQRNIVKQQTLASTSSLSASERPKIGFVKSGGMLRLVKFGANKSKTKNVSEQSETVIRQKQLTLNKVVGSKSDSKSSDSSSSE